MANSHFVEKVKYCKNMKKNLSITIGIPAYNEEKTIQKLLLNLLSQKEEGFYVKEIFVVIDGSSDQTKHNVMVLNNKKIKIVANKRRKGQVFAQNLITAKATSDFVVILEADTLPKDSFYLKNLIAPYKKSYTGVIQGMMSPRGGNNLIGKIVTEQFTSFYEVAFNDKELSQWVCSGRGGKIIPKSIYKHFIWEKDVPEDVYLLLWCKQNKIAYKVCKTAVVYYQCATTFDDVIKERQKVNSAELSLSKHFPKTLVDANKHLSTKNLIKVSMKFFMNSPHLFLSYLILKGVLAFTVTKKEFSDFWPTTYSTKKLAHI